MKKRNLIILSSIAIVVALCLLVLFNSYNNGIANEYSFIINNDDNVTAIISITSKRNNDIASIKLYAKYDGANKKYLGEDELINRTDIISSIKETEGCDIEYKLTSIPNDQIIDYEKISIDFDKTDASKIKDVLDYLGLSEYINNNQIKIDINYLKEDTSFPYQWIRKTGKESSFKY